MEAKNILSKLKAAVPTGILDLDTEAFGGAIWVEPQALPAAAAALFKEGGLLLDWAENISAAEVAGTLVLTYFLRSTRTEALLVLRSSIELPDGQAEANSPVSAPSVCSTWPMAKPFESEIQELFGVYFLDGGEGNQDEKMGEGRSFPMRARVGQQSQTGGGSPHA